jgi:hypothetical protein
MGGQLVPETGWLSDADQAVRCARQWPGGGLGWLDVGGNSWCSWQTVRMWSSPRDRRRSARIRSTISCWLAATGRSPAIRVATSATECASVASVLRPGPVANTRARADSFGGTSTICSPSASSRRRGAGRCPGTAVFAVLSPLQAVVFLVVQQGLFGVYLGSSFAPTRKACLLWARTRNSISCAARSSPHATSAAAGSPTSPLAGSTTRLSTTCSRPCRGRVCVTPRRPCGILHPARHSLLRDTPAGLLCAGTAPPPCDWPDGRPGTGCWHGRRMPRCGP